MVACPGECHIQLSVDDVAALNEAVGGEELHLPCVVHGERIDDDFALSGQPFGYVVRTIRKKSDRLQTARKGVQEYTAVFLETAQAGDACWCRLEISLIFSAFKETGHDRTRQSRHPICHTHPSAEQGKATYITIVRIEHYLYRDTQETDDFNRHSVRP